MPMKISEKLFIFLLVVIVAFVMVSSIVIIDTLKVSVESDRIQMTRNLLGQMLDCYAYSLSEISTTVHQGCRSEQVAYELTNSTGSSPGLNLRLKLDSIISNSAYVKNGFVADNAGNLYFSSSNSEEQVYRDNYDSGLYFSNADNFWVVDSDNRLFLRSNLYQMHPYLTVGSTVFEMDLETMRSVIGFDNFQDGETYIFNKYGTVMLRSQDNCEFQDILCQAIDQIRLYGSVEQMISYGAENYYVIAVGDSSRYNAIHIIQESRLLKTYYGMQSFILVLAVISVFAALFISVLFSRMFTRRLKLLGQSMQAWKGEREEDLSYRVAVNGRDEIGELSAEFNRLLTRIEELHQKILEESRTSQMAKYELLEFKYRSLQAQISPHFLCNVMNTISMLAAGGNIERVQKLAIDSGTYLRDNLRSNDKRYNTLREELRLVTEYIQLANTISAVPLRFHVDCNEETASAIVPNMILQPLVENSIKHGIPARMEGTFDITIRITTTEDEWLRITIFDNGVGYAQSIIDELERTNREVNYRSSQIGFGTAGVIRRLQLQYENDFRFIVRNGEDGGAVTIIELPLE